MRNLAAAAFLSLALVACATPGRRAGMSDDLRITDVTVIDPASRQVLPGRTVSVADGRIVAVTKAGERRRPALRSLSGKGRFLVPGLLDMHVHLFLPEPPEPTLALMLANGVTGYREMSSDCWALLGATKGCIAEYQTMQARVANGEMPGPTILSTTSTMVMGPTRLKLPPGADPMVTPRTAREAQALVRHLAARGVDRIKTHDSIPAEVFFALMSEARTAGIEVAGHVPFGAGSLGAAQAGYRSIEHARDLLYDCSRYGPAFRQASADHAAGKSGAVRPDNVERLERTVAEFDPEGCRAFLARLAKTGVYYVPTHVTREMEARADEPAYRDDPARRYMLAARDAAWTKDLDETTSLPERERAALDRFFAFGLEVTGLAHAAGIPVMAGTDASDTMIVPGFALHRELALLARAGLSPMDVLRAATNIPARYLGRGGDFGAIAPGMEADLLLLTADPLADVGNLRLMEAVIADGRVYERPALDGLLAGAMQKAIASRADRR